MPNTRVIPRKDSFFSGTFWSGLAFITPLAIYLSSIMLPFAHVPVPVEHLLLTLTAVMGVHLLDRWFLFRETSDELQKITSQIELSVTEQVQTLVDASSSLQAMNSRGLDRIYAQRTDAAIDMAEDLKASGATTICLIGISLNDFVRGDNVHLRAAWIHIKSLIAEDRSVKIRFMLIDPNCYSAALRARGESRTNASAETRLKSDVLAMAQELLEQERVASTKSQVTFKCRFYSTAPVMFLCQTDTASYVQQYYFWSDRSMSPSTPVFKFRQRSESESEGSIHDGMRDHFDWLWKHGSKSLTSVLDYKEIGVDSGIGRSRIANIFASGAEGRERICALLAGAKKHVWIQGISLHSFFSKGGNLSSLMADLISDANIEVKVLVIDKQSEQAVWRAYRERLLVEPTLMYEDYAKASLQRSHLVVDTSETIERLRELVAMIAAQGGTPALAAGEYKTASACFLLRVDDSILVEQYHYGHPQDTSNAAGILGNDMPLIEFTRNGESLFDPNELPNPFDLLVNNFEFVFAQAAPISLVGTMSDNNSKNTEGGVQE